MSQSSKDRCNNQGPKGEGPQCNGMHMHPCLAKVLDDVSTGLDKKPQSWHEENHRYMKAVYAKTRNMDVVEHCFKKKICDDLNRDFAEKFKEHAAWRPSGVCEHEDNRHLAAHAVNFTVNPNTSHGVSSTTGRADKYSIGNSTTWSTDSKRYNTRSSSKNGGAGSSGVSSSSKDKFDPSKYDRNKDKYATSQNKHK